MTRDLFKRSLAVFIFLVLVTIARAGGPAHAQTVISAASSTIDIDQNPLTSFSAAPTITGTAIGVRAPLKVVVVGIASPQKKVYENDTVFVHAGRWTATILPAIPNGHYTVEASSGTALATSSLTIGLQSFPTVSVSSSLPPYDVADGRLMRFAVTAGTAGPVGLAQLTFAVDDTSADVSDVAVTEYADSQYTQLIASSTDSTATSSLSDPNVTLYQVQFPSPIEIPAGQSGYFEVDGTVSPSDTVYIVTTTLLGDSVASSTSDAIDLSQNNNFVWSPNTYDVATSTEEDWTNGSSVAGLPLQGLRETRTGAPQLITPTCSINASTSTISSGQPVLLTWSSNAIYGVWTGTNASAPASGSETVAPSATHVYTLIFYGLTGATPCSSTVVVLSPGGSSTSTASTTSDNFSGSPSTGTATLAVTFNGTVNTAAACGTLYYLLSYGDQNVSQIVVNKTCKAQVFTLTHSYTKVGTYAAILYKATSSSLSTTSAQQIEQQSIVVKAKIAALENNNLANAWTGFELLLQKLFGSIP